MGRWDQQNWADICASGLKARAARRLDGAAQNLLPGLRTATAFKGQLASIHAARDECCRDHLQAHAFRLEKVMLVKMKDRLSNRRCFWQNNFFKWDYSKRDADGNRLPKEREKMMSDCSKVDAPELFAKKAMLEMIKEETEDVHEESDDRKAAAVRDVAAAMLHKIDTAEGRGCGGLSKVNYKPVWIMLSMDGAGITNGPGESGVRLVFYLGPVEKMNQSRYGITNLVTYKAAQHAESY